VWARVRAQYGTNRPFWLGALYGILALLSISEFGPPLRSWLIEQVPQFRSQPQLLRYEVATFDESDLFRPVTLLSVGEPKLQPITREHLTQTSQTVSSVPEVNTIIEQSMPQSQGLSSYSAPHAAATESAVPASSLSISAPFSSESQLSASAASSSAGSPVSTSPTGDFPAFENAVHPVTHVPNWGAMTNASQWERRYENMTESDFVPIPRYNLTILTTPMSVYLEDRLSHTAEITAKLYYSTRHMGSYDLDMGEYTGTHVGLDLKLAPGTTIGAVAGGRVHVVGTDDSLGLYVIIEHRHPTEGIFFSVYGHFEEVFVQAGTDVTAGQAIGRVGMTGQTTAPHLHLQIDRDTGARPHIRYRPIVSVTVNEADRFTVSPIEFIGKY